MRMQYDNGTRNPECGQGDKGMTVNVQIQTIRLSDDRKEHYVTILNRGKRYDVHKFSEQHVNRARYERDMLRHVLMDEPKPDLLDPKYAET